MQILVVEDDKRISDFLVKGLEESGHLLTLCKSAEEVLDNYTSLPWDVIICDIMLPKMDGIQLVQTLRYKKLNCPIIMLSALNTTQDKVAALDSGADDYLTKPFHFDELISRINALARRNQLIAVEERFNIRTFNDLQIDLDQFRVSLNNQDIKLSPREYKLLIYLVENKDRAVSRTQILNAVWGLNFDNQTNVVDVYISYLRSKIENADNKFIYTVKGVGYIFKL